MPRKLKLPKLKLQGKGTLQIIIVIFIATISTTSVAYAAYLFQQKQSEIKQLDYQNSVLQNSLNYASESYTTQIDDLVLQAAAAQEELNKILEENQNLKGEFNDFNDRAIQYINTKSRIADYKNRGIDVGDTEESLEPLYDLLLNESYEEFDGKYSEVDTLLTANKEEKDEEIAAAQAAAAAAAQATAAQQVPAETPTTFNTAGRNQYSSYEQKYVVTDVGSFWCDIIMIDTNNPNLRIITDTADEKDDCWAEGCAALSLGDYVTRNSGFAGIHGSYFCPPDYSACVDKPYSFDLAAYNSRKKMGKSIFEISGCSYF